MKPFLFLLTVLAIALCIGSCNESSIIGSDLLPGEDDIYSEYTDTFKIITTTLREDSVKTTDMIYYQLGSDDDPTIGKTIAGIYTEVRLPTNDIDLGENLVLDSAVLTLRYARYYGDTLAAQGVQVFRVLENIDNETAQYSNKDYMYDPVTIGSKQNFIPNLTDTIEALGINYPAHLRIRLDDVFGTELLNLSGTDVLSNDSSFVDYMKGFFITADTVNSTYGKGIMSFDLDDAISRLSFYYSNDESDSLLFNFPIKASSAKVNRYIHNYGPATTVQPYLAMSDTVEGDDLIFIQGLAGLKARINIPNLDKLKDVAINKAELIFTIAEDPNGLEGTYPPPGLAYLIQPDSSGANNFFVADNASGIYLSITDQLEGLNHYGATKLTETNEAGEEVEVYKYNFTRHLQAIVNENTEYYGFYLVAFPFYRNANRAVLAGSSNPNPMKRPKIAVTYTLIQ